MKMNKMFTGLIALVAGVALSAGSAFATNGYVGGDFARMKLVPYYETGDSRATIIGIQNLSPRETATTDQHTAVMDLQNYLDGENPSQALIDNATDDITAADGVALDTLDLTEVAAVEAALEAAQMAVLDEYVFVAVNVYDAMGMLMENASAELCLKEHQFGVVVLQGPSAMMAEGYQMQTLSMMDGDIPAYGYVEIMADTTKYSACGSESFRDPVATIVADDADSDPNTVDPAQSMIAAWTIIQDIGDGFFGTEVPTSTITMGSNLGEVADDAADDGDPELTCYGGDTAVVATATTAPDVTGNFDMTKCGLIPERHNMGALDSDTTTNNANAIARYDVGDESMTVVWLAAGGDTDETKPSARRMLDVLVKCEDGTVMMASDIDGAMSPAQVAAPGMLTMIDPAMGAVGELTDMCEGDRGVLRITMPNGSVAGMVFTHITQMGGHYRMNFPGYSKADNLDVCSATLPAGAPASACK